MTQQFFVLSDGLELAVESFGSGPPLIFAHGLTGSRRNTRDQFAPLADRYRIIAYDQRGHGDSTPVTDPALYDASRMASDMAAILDALDIRRAIVGGESMGTATALLFALKWPQRVKALLLTAPAFGDAPNPEREWIRDAGKLIASQGMKTWLEQSAEMQRNELGWPQAVIDYIAEIRRTHNPASIAVACQTVVDWVILPDLQALAALDFPTCIIAWPNDPLHPIGLARRMADVFPNARLELLPSLVHLFSQPAVFGEIYGRFLADIL